MRLIAQRAIEPIRPADQKHHIAAPLAPAAHEGADADSFTVFGDDGGKVWRRCANFLTAAGCNWMVPAEDYSPILQDAVDAVRDEATEALVVDLTGVDFLASAGMTVLVQSHQSVPDGVVFSVVATGAATARPLQLVGLDETFPIHASRQDALAATGDARRSDFA